MRNLREREGGGEREKIILYCDDEERKYHIMTIIPYHTIHVKRKIKRVILGLLG